MGHNYKNVNLQTQPKRKYWQEGKSVSRCIENKTTLDNQLYLLQDSSPEKFQLYNNSATVLSYVFL